MSNAKSTTGVITLMLGLAVSAYVFWPAGKTEEPRDPYLILDDTAELRSDGIEFNVVLTEPAKVTVTLELPNDLEGWAWFGLPASATPRDRAYRADRKEGQRFRAPGTFEQTVMSPAVYVVHVDAIPVAMGNEGMPMPVHVTVRAVPIGERQPDAKTEE